MAGGELKRRGVDRPGATGVGGSINVAGISDLEPGDALREGAYRSL